MYIEEAIKVIRAIEKEESENIATVSEKIVSAIKNKNAIYTFGASHAGMISEEFFYRAGGLVVINPIFASDLMLNENPVTHTSRMERLEGYGRIIGQRVNFKKDDILIVQSISGRNPAAIDLTLYAKEKGVYVVAVTNLNYAKSVTSRHSSQKKLYELADIVIDNHGEVGDASVKLEGLEQKLGPTSTIAMSVIVNSIVENVAKILIKDGITPPIFYSANLDIGDQKNEEIKTKYEDIIHYNY